MALIGPLPTCIVDLRSTVESEYPVIRPEPRPAKLSREANAEYHQQREGVLKPALQSSPKRGSVIARAREGKDMPDVPDPDFVGTLCEIWSVINYAAYHLAYVRVYLQTAALQTHVDEARGQEQAIRDQMQADVVICRAHLAAFFWQIDHVFEALRIAIARGQKEHGEMEYFWKWEQELKKIEETPLRQEISTYRNRAHEIPAIIGCWWEGGKFVRHFLPTIEGHEPKESADMNAQLQRYFEFVANVWLSFAPGDFKDKFPRNFKFPVTVPHSFIGELPPELKSVPQLEVSVEAYNRQDKSFRNE